ALIEDAGTAGRARRPGVSFPRPHAHLTREGDMDEDEPPTLAILTKVADHYKINGLVFDGACDPSAGTVHWDPLRSIWNGGMLVAAVVLGPIYFSWSSLGVFLALCFVTLRCGHSVGFHRRLIHRSFKCPKWLERILIYLGTVVGMGGPLWTIRTHDMRD